MTSQQMSGHLSLQSLSGRDGSHSTSVTVAVAPMKVLIVIVRVPGIDKY